MTSILPNAAPAKAPRERLTQKRVSYNYKDQKKRSGFASPASLSISTNGRPYTRLVVDAFYSKNITSHDVAGYLGVKLKHLKQISETVGIG
jgi:hypothetical protein